MGALLNSCMTGVFKEKNVLDKSSLMLKQLAPEIRPDFMLVCEQERTLIAA